ncbi:MAG TPA: radical SAM protein [Gemmataceae bacterium]|jgi:MoaA/NifB/PqqE/SkfB family radical SAM enzyme|nr:radical SAM protein [Gemmataceae bacterium]
MSQISLDVLPLDDQFSPWKILTYPAVLQAIRDDAQLSPINLEINPTNVCNQSCHWCTYGYLHDRKEFLPLEVVLALLRDARALGIESVTWTGGGEPTVYQPLPDVIVAAAELGFRQGLNSNGALFTPYLMDLVTAHLTYVRFSVDAGTPATYSRTHRISPEVFSRVTGHIAELTRRRDAGLSRTAIGFSFLVDASNVDDLLAAARLARELGVDYFQIKPIVHYVVSNFQFAEHSELWHRMEAQLDDVFALQTDRFAIRFLGFKFHDIKQQEQHYGRTYDQCRGNELLANVGADGNVDVCCAYKGHPDWSFGNLHEQSFREVWQSERRQQILGRINVKKCPPLCKAHEMNKVFHYVRHFDTHREFI